MCRLPVSGDVVEGHAILIHNEDGIGGVVSAEDERFDDKSLGLQSFPETVPVLPSLLASHFVVCERQKGEC